jgi:hypothetical protein
MTLSLSSRRVAVVFAAGVTAALLTRSAGHTADAAAVDPQALARTRETVRMLDDLHKGYVVHITDTYVKAQESAPAARVAKKVFRHMEEKGWGAGRLVDASGKPFSEANLPKTDFEKKAVAAIKSGKPYYDEVGEKNGKPVLRAATVVPAVMPQCVKCHEGAKEGDVLGILSYELPIR